MGVPHQVTIVTPDGELELPRQPSAVSEHALREAGALQTLSVSLDDSEIPDELLDPSTACDCTIIVTYYLTGEETRTYSGDVDTVERHGSHNLVTFTANR